MHGRHEDRPELDIVNIVELGHVLLVIHDTLPATYASNAYPSLHAVHMKVDVQVKQVIEQRVHILAAPGYMLEGQVA